MNRRTFCKLSGGVVLALTLPPLPAPAPAPAPTYNFTTYPDTGLYLSNGHNCLVVDGLHALRESFEYFALTAEQSAEVFRLFRVPRHLIERDHPHRSNAEARASYG